MAYDGLSASLMFAYYNRLAISQVLIFRFDISALFHEAVTLYIS